MNKLEIIKEYIRISKHECNIKFMVDRAVYEKEIEMLDVFTNKLEALEEYCNKLEEEKEELKHQMDNYANQLEAVGNELDRLGDFIIEEIEGEPSQSEGTIDTTIRLLKQYNNRPSVVLHSDE